MKTPKPPPAEELVKGRRLLIIRWEDHWASPGWMLIEDRASEDSMEPYWSVSIGWEIGRNKSVVKLAQSLNEGAGCAEVITILLSAIVSEEEVYFVK